MKYFIFLTFVVNIAFAQGANGKSSNSVLFINWINPTNTTTYINEDLNKDGKSEVLKGEKILKLAENEYWVKNTTLTSNNGDIFEFEAKLKKNDTPLITQVKSEYGYILVFGNNKEEVEVFIAGIEGSKESDPVYISLK